MDSVFPITFFLIYSVIVIAAFVALIYFIVKRIEDKKKETFEDRDN